MLKEYIKSSNIIEMIEEDSNEDESMHKATLRVTGSPKDWSSLIKEALMCPDDDSDYMLSIRKEYYISDENTPTFVWVLVIWGNLSEAFDELGPVLQQRASTETKVVVPPAADPPAKASSIKRKSYRSEDGVRVVSSIPLPFRRGNRDNPGTTKTLGSPKGIGAYVSNVTGGGL